MAVIGTALMTKILGHSDAEKAFRPWWDNVQDNLVYGLVTLGIIVVPTAIITGTPLDCNYCQGEVCTDNGTFPHLVNERDNPGFSYKWVRQYCTMNGSVNPFMLYFPYLLLLVALALFFIERMFVKTFGAGSKLEKFYALLMSQNILVEQSPSDVSQLTADGGKMAIELRQTFRGSHSFFYCYLGRTILEILVAAILLVYMLWRGIPVIQTANTIICNAHSYYYECSGQPAKFYVYILYIACCLTILFIICNIYNVLWLVMPCFGELRQFMSKLRSNTKMADNSNSSKYSLGDLFDIYYVNKDLGLLLDLLATSSGVAPAIAIMALLDKNFGDALKPEIKYATDPRDTGNLEVSFEDPKNGIRSTLATIQGVRLLYVAEILPPVDISLQPFQSQYISEAHQQGSKGDMTSFFGCFHKASFKGLKEDEKYTVKVRTIVNGRSICQVTQNIETENKPMESGGLENSSRELESSLYSFNN